MWVADSDGKGARKLCASEDNGLESPAWTADGKQIVYSAGDALFAASFGTNVNCTAADLGDGDDPDASWNGGIALDRLGDSRNRSIFTKPKGGAAQGFTDGSSDDYDPAWSPDGTKIVFVSDRDGNAEIYVATVGGGGATNLTNDPPESDPDDETSVGPAQDGAPAWQPLLP